ncbi:hypothetical protein [Synechococcus sp. CBW1006]|uniref:hypothetical protein n=1 Tax=Synechococcus sp. CBW1006 TaxID=1353138 RepID=UPI0018CEDAEB|nr:hypothetical protein [Synechococcus sp. CBW1006]QPN65919.1 hypothetical protein H8F26_13775 [Synechococcus sp. CBW1006]
MSLANDLLTTAGQLAQLHERRPRQADLRRELSTAYYALFHGLAETAADRLVGATPRIDEANQALAALQRVPKAEQIDFVTLALGMTRG